MANDPNEYEVVQTFNGGSGSAWSIEDENGNTPGFCFDSAQAAQEYLDARIDNVLGLCEGRAKKYKSLN